MATRQQQNLELRDLTIEQLVALDALNTQKEMDRRHYGVNHPWELYLQQLESDNGFRVSTKRMRSFRNVDPMYYHSWHQSERLYPGLQDVGNMQWTPTYKELNQYLPAWFSRL